MEGLIQDNWTKSGFMLVMPNEYTSVNEMNLESIKGIQEEGTQLIPTSGVENMDVKGMIRAD